MNVSPAVEWCAEMTLLIVQAAFLLIPAKVGQESLCSHGTLPCRIKEHWVYQVNNWLSVLFESNMIVMQLLSWKLRVFWCYFNTSLHWSIMGTAISLCIAEFCVKMESVRTSTILVWTVEYKWQKVDQRSLSPTWTFLYAVLKTVG